MRLHGDYNESKSHRFFVRLFGACGLLLACYWILNYVAGIVTYFGDPIFRTVILSIGGIAAFIYIRHEWQESTRLEREWEESELKAGEGTKSN